jgi:hypothetical protein
MTGFRPAQLKIPAALRRSFPVIAVPEFLAWGVIGVFSAVIPALIGQILRTGNLALTAGGLTLMIGDSATAQVAAPRLRPATALVTGLATLAAGLVSRWTPRARSAERCSAPSTSSTTPARRAGHRRRHPGAVRGAAGRDPGGGGDLRRRLHFAAAFRPEGLQRSARDARAEHQRHITATSMGRARNHAANAHQRLVPHDRCEIDPHRRPVVGSATHAPAANGPQNSDLSSDYVLSFRQTQHDDLRLS